MLFWCNASFAECIEGNCKNGQGTYTWASGENAGDKYVGEWKDGKRQTTTKVTKSYTPTTTWWDRTVWFFEDLFESDESEKDKKIKKLEGRIKRLESNRGTTNEIRELKKCVQDLSMGLPCYVH